jgi:malonyl-CoA decarboxylase
LAGVSFGDFLIKRVVEALRADLPKLATFATLSPMPGFAAWLDKQEDAADLRALMASPGWHLGPAAEAIREPVLRHAARYLTGVKDGKALDRVAHFHLSNGARVERINWLGDSSPAGLKQAHGLMVNYRYKLDEIEANHEAYVADGQVPAVSAVAKLAKG